MKKKILISILFLGIIVLSKNQTAKGDAGIIDNNHIINCLVAPTSGKVIQEERKTGVVKFYNVTKGIGVITPDAKGAEVLVLRVYLIESGIKELKDGDKVSYITVHGVKQLEARSIKIIK